MQATTAGLGIAALIAGHAPLAAGRPARGPLHVSADNPRYFADSGGTPVYLAGAHDGWELQDYAWGDQNAGVLFDWDGFLNFLTEYNHNVIRLWVVEHTKITDGDADLTTPMPYLRVEGQGRATDGQGKFDLDRWNEAYFERLRARTLQAGERGIYVIVMLFQGWSIEDKGGRVHPWPYHPFHRANNVSGIDADFDGDGKGCEVHTWLGEDHPITQRQRAYVRRVVDTVNDLDNVLYEIANESGAYSTEWQCRMIEFIREYERTKPKQHPIGMTFQHQGGTNAALLASPADWISPNREGGFRDSPPPAEGRKVVLSDTDHLFGVGCKDHRWVWKTFCRGHNCLYMDAWTLERADAERERVRRALGDTRRYADRMDLRATLPCPELASSGYCLASEGTSYLTYLPEGGTVTVDLGGARGELRVEWFSPSSRETFPGKPVAGGAPVSLEPPFEGDAVAYVWREMP